MKFRTCLLTVGGLPAELLANLCRLICKVCGSCLAPLWLRELHLRVLCSMRDGQ